MSFSQNSETVLRNSASLDSGAGMSSHGPASNQHHIVSTIDTRKQRTPATKVIRPRPQQSLNDVDLRSRIDWQDLVSPHFVFHYDPDWFPLRHAEAIREELEEAYSLIFRFTHESFRERWNVYAVDHRSPKLAGFSVRSHLSCPERSLCLIQTSSQHLYGDLVQLLTHAMRVDRYGRHYFTTPGWSSLEDAFALFLNERLSLQPDVFPFFGADPDLIAHHIYYHQSNASVTRAWMRPTQERSLTDLILFAGFFLYLGDTFSDDRIVEFSKIDGPVTDDEFRSFFGASLDELEHSWISHLPVSRISSTLDEQEQMVMRWDRAIDSCRL